MKQSARKYMTKCSGLPLRMLYISTCSTGPLSTPPGRTCTSSTKTRPVASCWKKHPLNPEAITRHGRPPEICVDTEPCGIPLLQFFVSDLSGQPASDDKPDVVASRVT